jgi:hypothetical protein
VRPSSGTNDPSMSEISHASRTKLLKLARPWKTPGFRDPMEQWVSESSSRLDMLTLLRWKTPSSISNLEKDLSI